MSETRPRFTILDETPCTILRAVHTANGGAQLQEFTPTGLQRVALTAAQLATFLRTLPLDVLNAALKWRLLHEPNQLMALDDAPATCPKGLTWDACEGADCQAGVCFHVQRPVLPIPPPAPVPYAACCRHAIGSHLPLTADDPRKLCLVQGCPCTDLVVGWSPPAGVAEDEMIEVNDELHRLNGRPHGQHD